MSNKKFEPKGIDGFTYSVNVLEELGRIPIVQSGVTYPVVVARMTTKDLSFDPDNLRLSVEDDVNGNFSASGQNRLKNVLRNKSGMERPAITRLKKVMELNQGQNELLWVQSRKGKPVVVEGNRRRSVAEELGWTDLIVYIFPDQMSETHVFEIVTQRHVAGLENWISAVQAEAAYKYMVEFGMPIEDVVSRLQFKSKKEAEKYIHAFVWWRESGLPHKDWSKFHHLYVPSMVNHFGYDINHWQDGSAPFKQELRKPTKEGAADPAVVDNIVADAYTVATGKKVTRFKANFQWFVNLIKDRKVTDCRQSDGIVAPAIRVADDPDYGQRVMEILQKPNPVRAKADAEDGKGTVDPSIPAQAAWNFLRDVRADNHLTKKVDGLIADLQHILKSKTRLGAYKIDETGNKLLRAKVSTLVVLLEDFEEKTVPLTPQKKKSKDAA